MIFQSTRYNLDEFQAFENVNPVVCSEIQRLCDLYKDRIKLNFIAGGSTYSLIMKIFKNQKEPLFGRLTSKILLKPFKVSVLKNIRKTCRPWP